MFKKDCCRQVQHAALKKSQSTPLGAILTLSALLFRLLPIMWSPVTQAGADVMKRSAAPMIGGVVTSAILELLIYPVVFLMWRGQKVGDES